MVEISTSILNVDEEEAMKTFYDLEVAKTDYYHIDVMDGKFVKKIHHVLCTAMQVVLSRCLTYH